jgi:hypothetical protein
MSEQPTKASESRDSVSWRLIREALARRELTGEDMVEVEDVSSATDGDVVVKGKDSAGTTVRRRVEADPTLERIAASAIQTSQQIRELHDQARQQAGFWFKASAVAAVLGFVLLFGGGAAVLFFQQSAVAILSPVCGVLLEATATLFFKQNAEANTRVDGYREDLLDAQAIYKAIELIKTSERPETRDRLREMIVKKLLGIEQSS